MKKISSVLASLAFSVGILSFSMSPASASEASPATDLETAIPLSGSFSSYISGWAPQSSPQSRTWTDNTAGTTSIRLSGCSTNGPQGFQNVTLRLTRTTGVNIHIGSRTNSCGPSSWSIASNRTGNFRFGSTHINGVNYYNGTWSANSVVVSY